MNSITKQHLKEFSKTFNDSPKNILARNAVTTNEFSSIVIDSTIKQKINEVFQNEIKTDVEASDQKYSGRCWLFAFLNVLRLKMMKKYKLKNFEFSQTYLFFWDKLEKCNFFLKNIINTRDHKSDSRLIAYLLKDPANDGGQWNMIVNLVEKYGLIPKCVMGETFQSENTEDLNNILNNKLRECACQIREMTTEKFKDIDQYLQNRLYEIYTILVIFLGEPPQKFSWEYYSDEDPNCKKKKKSIKKKKLKNKIKSKKCNKDDDKFYNIISDVTPLQFYQQYVPFNCKNKICLVHAPNKNKPYFNLYNLKYFGNLVSGQKTNYVNIPLDMMKQIACKSIDKNEAIWFGSDVGQYHDTELGILDTNAFKYKNVLGFDFTLNKAQRLEYGISTITHAMVLKGYNTRNKKINKWLVENSWGSSTGDNGNFIMSDDWFSEYVYEIVVDKKYVSKKVLDVLKKKPIELEPWDPFGKLL